MRPKDNIYCSHGSALSIELDFWNNVGVAPTQSSCGKGGLAVDSDV